MRGRGVPDCFTLSPSLAISSGRGKGRECSKPTLNNVALYSNRGVETFS